ncbi:carbohydrate-binding protein [Micromonospora sp. MS34]|uniref:carbohydrate-binding protein n=1 Tax=Micromonospora sp. MS34 TaxID=3385971 RepID=UPI0039A020A7
MPHRSPTGPLLGAPGVLGTGGRDTFQQLTYNITGFPAGTTSIAVVFRASDSNEVANLDWLRFLA